MAMLTMLFDGGIAGDLKEQLLISLQDQIDNVVGPKMARNLSMENGRTEGMGDRGALRNVSRLVDRAGRMGRVEPEDDEEQQTARTAQAASGGRRENRRNGNRVSAAVKTAAPAPETPAKESIRDALRPRRASGMRTLLSGDWSRWRPAGRRTGEVMKTGSGI